jgi:hypothetical protein
MNLKFLYAILLTICIFSSGGAAASFNEFAPPFFITADIEEVKVTGETTFFATFR